MSFEIELRGLTARQSFLADIIWAFEEKKDIDRFIKALPTKELRDEADTIVQLMIMATVEQAYGGLEDTEEAQNILAKIAKKG